MKINSNNNNNDNNNNDDNATTTTNNNDSVNVDSVMSTQQAATYIFSVSSLRRHVSQPATRGVGLAVSSFLEGMCHFLRQVVSGFL